ncbi:PH domain-containing protein [Nocardioides antri]|uniref:PH domain-containing protein n=1 Tax=Nocardioides antri TaxID=2607659 RepID=A0A5B1M4U8_9ACTN|nr:PH domain-containing protein [Nocardioides antri]KAA1427159.1 PH domain-containing protein [Nocardioides antri]
MTELRDPAHRVSPRARTLWRLQSGIGGAVVVLGLVVAAATWREYDGRWWVVLVAAVLAAAYAVVVPQWRFAVHRWEITDTAVYTQRGWWARERRIAPMSRVQTVDLAEGPLDRLFGLTTLTVTTASAAGPLRVEGLERGLALQLSQRLTRNAEDAGGDAT